MIILEKEGMSKNLKIVCLFLVVLMLGSVILLILPPFGTYPANGITPEKKRIIIQKGEIYVSYAKGYNVCYIYSGLSTHFSTGIITLIFKDTTVLLYVWTNDNVMIGTELFKVLSLSNDSIILEAVPQYL